MEYQDLRVAIADGVAEGTLDRPEQRNAFSGPRRASLARARGRDGVSRAP
jgi:hypothetical protein